VSNTISNVWCGVRPNDTAAFVDTSNKQSAYSVRVSFNYKIYASRKIKFSRPPSHPHSLFCTFMKKSLISFFRYFRIFVAPECALKRTSRNSSFFLITGRGKKCKVRCFGSARVRGVGRVSSFNWSWGGKGVEERNSLCDN